VWRGRRPRSDTGPLAKKKKKKKKKRRRSSRRRRRSFPCGEGGS
jgi:hypothetical protein